MLPFCRYPGHYYRTSHPPFSIHSLGETRHPSVRVHTLTHTCTHTAGVQHFICVSPRAAGSPLSVITRHCLVLCSGRKMKTLTFLMYVCLIRCSLLMQRPYFTLNTACSLLHGCCEYCIPAETCAAAFRRVCRGNKVLSCSWTGSLLICAMLWDWRGFMCVVGWG